MLAALLLFVSVAGWGQTTVLTEDFAAYTKGGNTTSSGTTAPDGTDIYNPGTTVLPAGVPSANFPTGTKAYMAGGMVKLGSSSLAGSMTSKVVDLSTDGGNVTVSFDVKGWSAVEGDIKVTITGQAPKTVTYAALMSGSLESKSVSFTGGVANSTVKIETTAKRAFIDNVKVQTGSTNTCTGPTTAASALAATNVTTTSADLGWTSGNGSNRVLFVKAGTFTSAAPANNTTYTADLSFTGAGTAFDGGKTVYNSNGSSVSVTNLTPNTAYNAKVFEYLGAAGSECYNTTPLSGSFTTVSNVPGVLDASNLADVSFDANWTAPTDNGGAAYTYTLAYSTSSTFASNVTAITNIASGTTTRAISGLTPATNYYYRVKVVNAGGSSAWSATKQTTTKPSAPPAPGAPTQACGSTTYPAYGSGAPYNTYYWQTTANGNSTANPGTSSFTVTASGTYYVRALSGTSNWSAATPVNAVVINNPVITAQPANKTVANGNTATFSVTATDAGSYQWQENNSGGWVDITDGGNYSGATTATLSVANANIGMDGYTYRVVVGGTAPCNGTVTSSAATLTVTVVTGSAAYFRSAATGNWTNIATWQSSPDNVNWYPATAVPTSSATQIDIRSGHTVSVTTASQNGKNIHVYGTLSLEEVFAVADDGTAAYDLTVENGGILSFPNTKNYTPTFGNGATALYRATSLTSFVNTSVVGNVLTDNGGSGTKMYFESGARFTVSISGSNSLKSSGVTYFPNADANTTPILQIATGTAQMSSAASNPTVINGRLEVASGATFTSSNGGDRTFRDGIINNGSFSGGTSNIYITGTNAQLGGTGTTTVGTNNSLIIDTGAVATQVTHMAITDGTVTVKGTLSNSPHAYKINANVNIEDGGKFVTYSEGGFFGGTNSAIQEKTPVLNTGSTVEYSLAGDQTITNAPVTTPSGANYQNLVVSGSGKKTTAPGSITVNEMTKVTSADAELIVPTPLDNTKIPNVFYALGGINNQNGGNFILGNDAQLMQNATAVNTNAKIEAQRKLSLTEDRKEYNYLISPVEGQDMKSIIGEDAGNIQFVTKINEATSLFVNAGDGPYVKGLAYAVKETVPSYNEPGFDVAKFKGRPFNEDLDFHLYKTANNRGYNLSGNPYPSNLDLDALYTASSNIESTFRFWDNKVNNIYVQQGVGYQGYSYAFYNAPNGTGVAAPGGNGMSATGREPNHILKVGQGFIIRVKSDAPVVAYPGTAATLSYRNSQRIIDQTDAQFFGKNADKTTKDRYWLEYVTPANLVINNAVVYFAGGNNSFSADDTRFPGSSDALYTMAEETKVLINGRSPFEISDRISIGIKAFTAGTYKIRVGKREGIFATGQSIYLKDKELGIVTDLAAGDYTFSSGSGEFTNRFEIVYKPAVVLAADDASRTLTEVYRDGSDFVVRADRTVEQVEVFDASGRLLLKFSGTSREIRFSASYLAEGIYVMKAQLKGGDTVTKKIRK